MENMIPTVAAAAVGMAIGGAAVYAATQDHRQIRRTVHRLSRGAEKALTAWWKATPNNKNAPRMMAVHYIKKQTKCRNGTPCPAAADPNPSILRYYHRIRTRMAASMPLSCAVRPASTLPVTSSMV